MSCRYLLRNKISRDRKLTLLMKWECRKFHLFFGSSLWCEAFIKIFILMKLTYVHSLVIKTYCETILIDVSYKRMALYSFDKAEL